MRNIGQFNMNLALDSYKSAEYFRLLENRSFIFYERWQNNQMSSFVHCKVVRLIDNLQGREYLQPQEVFLPHVANTIVIESPARKGRDHLNNDTDNYTDNDKTTTTTTT